MLRHASFKGLREDKSAEEVVENRPRDGPRAGPGDCTEGGAETGTCGEAAAEGAAPREDRTERRDGRDAVES